MNKSIASIALLAASMSVSAMGPVVVKPEPLKTVCLSIYENSDNTVAVGTCDMTAKNEMFGTAVLANKCADGQASFTTVNPKIKSCPTYIQL